MANEKARNTARRIYSLKKALEKERAVTASLLRYIEALEKNLDCQKENVQELRKRLERLNR